MGGGLCKSQASVYSKPKGSFSIHMNPNTETFSKIKDRNMYNQNKLNSTQTVNEKKGLTPVIRNSSQKTGLVTRSDNSKTTVGKHQSDLWDLDSVVKNNDIKRTYHANFGKRMNTDSDTESVITDNRMEYHKVDIVGDSPLWTVHKAVNLRNGKNLAIKEFKFRSK